METREYLMKKLHNELNYSVYERLSGWYIGHINRIVNCYPFLKLGAIAKADVAGEIVTFKVKGFIISGEGILLDTGYGNVFYYETFEAFDEKGKKIIVLDEL